jgi:hypothetical protein
MILSKEFVHPDRITGSSVQLRDPASTRERPISKAVVTYRGHAFVCRWPTLDTDLIATWLSWISLDAASLVKFKLSQLQDIYESIDEAVELAKQRRDAKGK